MRRNSIDRGLGLRGVREIDAAELDAVVGRGQLRLGVVDAGDTGAARQRHLGNRAAQRAQRPRNDDDSPVHLAFVPISHATLRGHHYRRDRWDLQWRELHGRLQLEIVERQMWGGVDDKQL